MDQHAIPEADIALRPLRRDEVKALAAVLWDEVSIAQAENRWREQELGYRRFLVAEVDGELAGTVSLHESQGLPGWLHLFALEVGPEWRNRGVGTGIVKRVLEEAELSGLRRVYLEVRSDNPARRLYHRLGFRRVGPAFLNTWWRFKDDGTREQVDETSYRMVRRIRAQIPERKRSR